MISASRATAQSADHHDAFAEPYARDTPLDPLSPRAFGTRRLLAFLFFTLDADESSDGMPR